MKGKVKIELRDKEGNLVSSQENNNLVTNLIDDLFLPLAFKKGFVCQPIGHSNSNLNNSSYYYTTRRMTLSMFDAIQLLGDELSEDPNDYIFGNQKVVGLSRYDLGYSNSNTLYGSFNGAESGWNEDKTEYTYVYDWTTAAANDVEIKSIALSPIWSCVAGCGVKSIDTSVYDSGKIIYPKYLFSSGYHDFTNKLYYMNTANLCKPYLFDYNDNSVICAKYTNFVTDLLASKPYITISKMEVPMSKYIIGNRTRYTDGTELPVFTDIATITIKNTLGTSVSYNYGFSNYCDGKIYALYHNSNILENGKSLTITVLDLETLDESYIDFTNNTGKSLSFHYRAYEYESCTQIGFVKNNTLYCVATDGTFWSINLNTSEATQITYEDGSTFKFSNYYYAHFPISIGDDVMLYSASSSSSSGYMYAINSKTNKVRICSNDSMAYLGNYNMMIAPFKDHPFLVGGFGYYNGNVYFPFAYPLIERVFSTKFNLEEPFTKNSEQSLKVIYTLKFDE